MSIGENIRYLRKKKKLTQKQLAATAEVNEVTIRCYESGKYEPKRDTVNRLAQALDCNVDEIINEPWDLQIPDFLREFDETTWKDYVPSDKHLRSAYNSFVRQEKLLKSIEAEINSEEGDQPENRELLNYKLENMKKALCYMKSIIAEFEFQRKESDMKNKQKTAAPEREPQDGETDTQ